MNRKYNVPKLIETVLHKKDVLHRIGRHALEADEHRVSARTFYNAKRHHLRSRMRNFRQKSAPAHEEHQQDDSVGKQDEDGDQQKHLLPPITTTGLLLCAIRRCASDAQKPLAILSELRSIRIL